MAIRAKTESDAASDEVAFTAEVLDERYDDLKSGKAELVPAAEVLERLHQKSLAWTRD